MWREVLESTGHTVELREPASRATLDDIESRLGQPVPDDLKQLLLETDGVEDEFGSEIIWSCERILQDNRAFRTNESYADLYMPFDSLMFFGDNGGGDQFAFVRTPQRQDVFVWEHETDSRNWVCPSLENYLRRALESAGEDWYRQA
ncbi:SMI1/KNR4 family protein [Streptomyces morookaense]|uniref:SMI1/KNR4 family protein n=1 Tax=Streptomyces morookaense TaxID=1970 RepID=A0A7Y7BA64_STRMO|nr:SMI1/KNR4 family protein [Streptomyces morookaense]NVK81745.1 SMI1/KNR4 family protein [Streptomyces morookaense]GHF43845.1 SMI1/KNR4 family protein [Streptomyces morookaense]